MISRRLTYKERRAMSLVQSYMLRKAYLYQRMSYWLDFAKYYSNDKNKLCFLIYDFDDNDYDNAGIFSNNVVIGDVKHRKMYFFKDDSDVNAVLKTIQTDIADYVLFDKDFSADNKRAIVEFNKFKLEQDFKEL